MPRTSSFPSLLLVIAAIAFVAVVAFGVALGVGALRDSGDEPAAEEPELLRDPSAWYGSIPAGVSIENVVGGFDAPSALTGTADGRIFVTEQFAGAVRVVRDGAIDPEPWYVVPDLYTQESVNFVSELGLVGVLADPDAAGGIKLYIYYAAISDAGVRTTKLVRLTERDGRGVEPATIFEVEGDPICCHIAGAMDWLPDGTMLVSVGDHSVPESAQDLSQPTGKILRIDRDGNAPRDNPFVGRDGVDERIYAYGLRNAFGVAIDPLGERSYVLDNGELGFDKIYELKAGANYGWSGIGVERPAGAETDLHTYFESMGLAGAVVYRGPIERFAGDLFFCQFHRGGALHWYDFERLEPFTDDFVIAPGCTTGLRVLPDGGLYYLDYGPGSLIRIGLR